MAMRGAVSQYFLLQYNVLSRFQYFVNSQIFLHVLPDVYFVPVVTYLIFSTGDYTGRVLSGILQWVYTNLYFGYGLRSRLYATFTVLVCIVTAKRQTVARDILQHCQGHFYTCTYVL